MRYFAQTSLWRTRRRIIYQPCIRKEDDMKNKLLEDLDRWISEEDARWVHEVDDSIFPEEDSV
jgi:hypothetical protein